jgi:hypothetical protein
VCGKKSKTEPRSKFFTWLALHDRVLTADNMLKKNWPYSETCSFCLCMFETTNHILLECNYTEAVWNIVAGKFGLPGYGFLSHSEGPLIRMDSANCRIWQQKRKKGETLASCSLFGGWCGKKGTGGFLSRSNSLIKLWQG